MKYITLLVVLISIGMYSQTTPGEYTVKNVITNTKYSDFGTSFFGKDKVIFASPKDNTVLTKKTWSGNDQPFLDLYIGTINEKGEIIGKQRVLGDVNNKFHEGIVSFTKDLKTVYFSANNYTENNKAKKDSTGIVNIQLYKATVKDNGEWTNVVKLPFNNDGYSTGHPALNKDDTKLYFVSDRPSSVGKTDIYVVDIKEDNTYSQPKNLGPRINTEEREMFPFISDESILYFSSTGHPGYGGLDVFASRIFDTTVSEPINLEDPVNSSNDDFAFIINDTKHKGYFSSNNRTDGKGDDDIYSFIAFPPLKIEGNQTISGIVIDKTTQEFLPGAIVVLLDEQGNEIQRTITKAKTNSDLMVSVGDLNQNNDKNLSTTTGEVTDIRINRTVDNPSPNAGEHVEFTVEVINMGTNEATGINVNDILPEGYEYISDDGEDTYQIESDILVIPSLAKGQTTTIKIKATTPRIDLNQNNRDKVSAITGDVTNIRVNKTVDNPSPKAGEQVEFTVEVINNGTAEATGIKVSEILPEGYEYISDDGVGTYHAGTDILNLPKLAKGEKTILKIKAITLTKNLNYATRDKVSVIKGDVRNVRINKTVNNLNPSTGEEVEFTVEAVNKGTSKVKGVKVTDILPSEFRYISDDGDGTYVPGTDILTIKNLAKDEIVKVKIKAILLPTGNDGSFNFEVKSDTKYKIAVIAPGYLREETEIKTTNETDIDPLELNISLAEELRVVDEKIMININTIYFDFDKWNIRPEAAKELDKVIAVMQEHPSMIIEGGSHTDSRAREAYNQVLSEKRANATMAYIIAAGIDPGRITAKGYGEMQLVNNCSSFVKCTREEHQLNRRTEFVIVNDDDRFTSTAATLENVKIDKKVNLTFVEVDANLTNDMPTDPNKVAPNETNKIDSTTDQSNPIEIAPIYFEFDKWGISESELKQLDEVVQIMKDNPTIIVEAGAHTDSKNLESYNQLLSEKRARSVVKYIVSKGITPGRIIGKGYGEMKLTNHCKSFVKCTPEEQQANRRTEFKIINR